MDMNLIYYPYDWHIPNLFLYPAYNLIISFFGDNFTTNSNIIYGDGYKP